MNKTIFLSGICLGALAIILGAFGAHGLEKMVDVDAIGTFETGVKYQLYHALFLMILAGMKQLPEKSKRMVFILIIVGTVLFSFSIYVLATNTLTDFNFKSIGFVTPIGGLLLIFGWLLLGYRVYREQV
ncbi:DUF423 domain-containing protein [Kriegella aquimaris]|uniref:Uncharacterized membrane protein YgdD, TMEM256/DUF423 family n=1 Tax=Kriegella aquimaris TaxID=192904 RepID=A0A1G9M6J5_9FLAO|nr:DUF423 domain-containing protein [Kriegella aquimaris]SDL69587.1 Uncharacterized membrane protein YgdD, TMEM256/DUF423 family [Kriegella aquimaris]